MSVNERIKEALERKDISYAKLGKRIGMTRGGVSNRINSAVEIKSENFVDAVVELTGVSKEWILTGESDKSKVIIKDSWAEAAELKWIYGIKFSLDHGEEVDKEDLEKAFHVLFSEYIASIKLLKEVRGNSI